MRNSQASFSRSFWLHLATFVSEASLLTKSFSMAFKRSLPAPSFATKWLLHHDCWWCTSPPCHASAALFPGFQLSRRWWHPPVGRTVLRPNRHRLWLHGWALVRPSLERWWATNLPSCLWSGSRTATNPVLNKNLVSRKDVISHVRPLRCWNKVLQRSQFLERLFSGSKGHRPGCHLLKGPLLRFGS